MPFLLLNRLKHERYGASVLFSQYGEMHSQLPGQTDVMVIDVPCAWPLQNKITECWLDAHQPVNFSSSLVCSTFLYIVHYC